MKKYKLITAAFVFGLAVILTCCTGCKTATNDKTAYWVGCTTHEAYTKIAATQSEQFKADVEGLWTEIDNVTEVMDITNVYAKVADKIDVLIQDKEITEKQRKTIKVLRKIFDNVVALTLSNESEKRNKAIAWLKKWREGIRAMRKLENGDEVEDMCDNCCIDGACSD